MQTIFHPASSRGFADHGWLQSAHTFSFANYYDPERIHFGALRVLNDDKVAAGRGFGKHPHDNMEIISIPLAGDLRHEDSLGNTTIIRQGDVQAMSAGTGVAHSEMNANTDQAVEFLQIWVFPRERDVTPSYSQITLDATRLENRLEQIVSPDAAGPGVTVQQDAWFHLGKLAAGTEHSYQVKKPGNGVYAFLLSGEASVAGQTMGKRDGLGVWETDQMTIEVNADAELLLMEVPMSF
ncbi:pirin family protein [Neolewinella lacunae]|uniref:Pirin family protein n=1 Tax=Neolewinella lacunae TaxID=1517758 RepID=A0A923T6V5_9BACT|nr:pirin family protein [Neolewinella lacunae]MBC6993820.1 pirin family protein [Neolewinella lacunae]MDN3635289.1 pirin family protein [Neolewinella lacunae]